MTQEEILEQLKQVLQLLKPKMDLGKVSMESSLVLDLGIDSLSLMMLALAIEDKFDIQFDTAVSFQTVGEVVEFIGKALAK